MKTEPTIGRMVWLRRHSNHDAQAESAQVTYVHPDGTVNLACYNHNGVAFQRTNVRLVQAGEDKPGNNEDYCEWMPFQVKDAAQRAERDAQVNQASQNIGAPVGNAAKPGT